ncbi:MAG: TIR domain-containing protein, partial [Bacilli bacterium]|nr:TIR domain-containing protein [Bacilli bacterium]
MIKLFISHSSRQKGFVERMVNEIGLDHCIVDAFDFSPAYPTMKEIVEKIGKSGVFVFLATKDSIKSKWCQDEVSLAKNLIENGQIKGFFPYIIDNPKTFDKIPDWIKSKDTYNLKYFQSPLLVAHDLLLKIRKLERSDDSYAAKISSVYVGRQRHLSEFEDKKSDKRKAKSMIVSGRVGLGRERFSDVCFEKVKGNNDFYTEIISLVHPQGLPDFIIQLNAITCMNSEERLTDILSSDLNIQIEAAIEMLNSIYATQGRVEIIDERSIVNYRAELAPWFEQLIDDNRLISRLGLNVISNVHPREISVSDNSSLIHIPMDDLSRRERFNILSTYLEAMDYTDYDEEDIWKASDKLVHSVSQLVNYAKLIKTKGIVQASRNIESLRDSGHRRIASVLEAFIKDKEAMDFLALMTQADMLSYSDIQNIYGKDYQSISEKIYEMIDHGLVLEFSSAHTLIRIDSAVKDHFERIKIKPSKKLRKKFKSFLEQSYSKGAKLTEEPSLYYIKCSEMLKSGMIKDVDSLLIPSIVIAHIIKLYNSGDKYQKLVDMCRQIVDSHNHSISTAGLIEEVLFWLCLSLAHIGDEKEFYKYVRQIKDNVSSNFLKGFYHRHQNNYNKALEYYENVLAKAPRMNMACREKVGVLIHLHRFDDALEMAESNYQRHPENTYHIDAYYKCLLRKRNRTSEDERLLDK